MPPVSIKTAIRWRNMDLLIAATFQTNNFKMKRNPLKKSMIKVYRYMVKREMQKQKFYRKRGFREGQLYRSMHIYKNL